MKPTRASGSGGARHLLDPISLVGDRWSLWLLAELADENGKRFNDLAEAPGLSRRVLTERLERLITAGLVAKRRYSARPPRFRYALSDRGRVAHTQVEQLLHVVGGGQLPASRRDDRPVSSDPADRLLGGDLDTAQQIWVNTIAPIAHYDEQYGQSLVQTLETYLACDGSVSIAATRLHAHRHTVRYRIGRIRELTGHDVTTQTGRERLAFGLRAMRVLASSAE